MKSRSLTSAQLALACAVAFVSRAACAQAVPYANEQTKSFMEKMAGDLKSGKLLNVDGISLGKAYAANEVSADAKYKGKYLFVSGIVESVKKDFLDEIVVNLKSSNMFLPVAARFDKTVAIVDGMEDSRSKTVSMKVASPTDAAGSLKKGQKIHLICKGDGAVISSPQLKVCDTLSR